MRYSYFTLERACAQNQPLGYLTADRVRWALGVMQQYGWQDREIVVVAVRGYSPIIYYPFD